VKQKFPPWSNFKQCFVASALFNNSTLGFAPILRAHFDNAFTAFLSVPRNSVTWETVQSVFWLFVDKDSSQNGCWIWRGSIQGRHGVLSFGLQYYAHRLSKCIADGIPYNCPSIKGLECGHNCPNGDNPLCVNPAHFHKKWLTRLEHMQDTKAKGQMSAGERHYTKRKPHLIRKGTACPWSKLSDEEVLLIRSLYADGYSQQAIAKGFNVSRSAIQQIVNGNRWKHLLIKSENADNT